MFQAIYRGIFKFYNHTSNDRRGPLFRRIPPQSTEVPKRLRQKSLQSAQAEGWNDLRSLTEFQWNLALRDAQHHWYQQMSGDLGFFLVWIVRCDIRFCLGYLDWYQVQCLDWYVVFVCVCVVVFCFHNMCVFWSILCVGILLVSCIRYFLSFSIFFGCYLDIDISFVNLGGGFKHFLFSPLPGEMIIFDEHVFELGWFNHQRPKTSLKHNPNSTCYICYPPPRQFVCAELTFHCHRNLRVPPQCYPPQKIGP